MAIIDVLTDAPDPWTRQLVGRFHGQLLILGSGSTLWEDYARFPRREDGHVMVLHQTGMHFPGAAKHWFSNYGCMIPAMAAVRHGPFEGRPVAPPIQYRHTGNGIKTMDVPEGYNIHVWPISPRGSQALGATLVGLIMGYDRIVLAGCPIDGNHYWDAPSLSDKPMQLAWDRCEPDWINARDTLFEGRVKSLSGRTRDWLGEP